MDTIVKPGHVSVVTGASSGIGRAAAMRWAAAGMHVWMLDIDRQDLPVAEKAVQAAAPDSQHVHSLVVDVSDVSAMEKAAETVYATEKTCHLLFNNAGIGQGGGALASRAVVERTMGVNFYGPIHGCLAFVPKMKQVGEEGLIINTGSKQGITCPPGNLVYNMSKAALKAYTEGLEHELMLERKEGKGKLRSVLLVPGWVNTSIALKVKREEANSEEKEFDPSTVFFHEDKPHSGAWMPSQVLDFLTNKVNGGSFYVICPDNDVDEETDRLRMTWAMQDVTQDRPPLSRWHPDCKDKFTAFLATEKK